MLKTKKNKNKKCDITVQSLSTIGVSKTLPTVAASSHNYKYRAL
jgi:hypothetical protein